TVPIPVASTHVLATLLVWVSAWAGDALSASDNHAPATRRTIARLRGWRVLGRMRAGRSASAFTFVPPGGGHATPFGGTHSKAHASTPGAKSLDYVQKTELVSKQARNFRSDAGRRQKHPGPRRP